MLSAYFVKEVGYSIAYLSIINFATLCKFKLIACFIPGFIIAFNPKILKGCGIGPRLVLVSPCFRENVVVTCKIGSFLCSLNNLLQKNVIVFFFWKSNVKTVLKGYFCLTHFSHFLATRGKLQNSFSTYLTHIYTRILLTLFSFFALPILKKKIRIYQVRFLFGMSPGVDFRAILEQSINNKMVSEI